MTPLDLNDVDRLFSAAWGVTSRYGLAKNTRLLEGVCAQLQLASSAIVAISSNSQ